MLSPSLAGGGRQGQYRRGLHQDVGDRVPVGLRVYVMMHAATDPANTMRAPVLGAPGTIYYRYSGREAVSLSHYSSTCIDPSNPNLFWTYQAYGDSTVDRQWCTGLGRISTPLNSR